MVPSNLAMIYSHLMRVRRITRSEEQGSKTSDGKCASGWGLSGGKGEQQQGTGPYEYFM